MNCYMPVRLFACDGAVVKNAEALRAMGRRAFIVCSASAAKNSGALDDALNALKGEEYEAQVFDGITANPRIEDVIAAGRAAHGAGADFILGIGGGSPMDAAKAVAVFAANPDMSEKEFYAKAWPIEPLPIGLIGTTAGTGSEVTMVSVLTDSSGKKHSIHDERLYARAAFGNARYMLSMKAESALSCGIDVIAHCVESRFSKKASALTRLYADEGVRMAIQPLERMLEGVNELTRTDFAPALSDLADDGFLTKDDVQALYEASLLGGMAINLTGTCFPHNMGYYLTERFHVPHGIASAAFLEDLLEFEDGISDGFYKQTGVKKARLIKLIRACTQLKNVFISPEELESALPRWQNNNSVRNTLGDVTQEDIRRILSKFVKGGIKL
ncbi:MAG: iron-containing alcohol dehydrogenase [Clostridia bacterium]|nr:iron-containing alcohol dehydrogenase [Clostridia bacterium]